MTTPLENYGMIGDGETAALISQQGSIDWLCFPRFDSPACCAALLGNSDHGHWTIAPTAPITRSEQRYQLDTMILETDLTSDEGTIRLTDFMPMRTGAPVLIRIVAGLVGSVETTVTAAFKFDYGNMAPWIINKDNRIVMQVGPDKTTLRGTEKFTVSAGEVRAKFVVTEGSNHFFVLTYGEEEAVDLRSPHQELAETQAYWRNWIARFDESIPYTDAVRRSLLTLKALIHRPTGGLVAAPTSSLPEQPGGKMNWDYRYCWLRDASFAVSAFVDCGFLAEASDWRDWIMRAAAGEPAKLKVMYRVDGSRRLDEAEVPWLPGYRFAKPVRIGNAAASQHQLDIYGEVIRTFHVAEGAGMKRIEQGRQLEIAIVRHIEQMWTQPDQGVWESRGEPRHYTYSKVMAWVALDRFLKGTGGDEISDMEWKRMQSLRDHIHGVICAEAFNKGLNSFTSYFGGQDVDASLLLLPKVGFLSAADERMTGTIALIEEKLLVDGLIRRHLENAFLPEGAFIACSFWLAECQLEQNRHVAATETIDRALAVRGTLGLFSEEYDYRGRQLAGNFPQALSHLALVQAILALAKFDRGSRSSR